MPASNAEIVDTGRCRELETLHGRLPPALALLLKVPGLGPKHVACLHRELGIRTPEELEQTLAAQLEKKRRFPLPEAERIVEALLPHLREAHGVKEVLAAGSYRRARETVGDLDVLATAERGSAVMERFVAYPGVCDALSRGKTRTTVVLSQGIQVDLRVVPAATFGAALQYFTGSKGHNIALRRLAQARGLKLNEYGVFRGSERVAGKSEPSVYRALGLPWIPPEQREDRGEIEAARAGALPRLIERADLKGDLHVHALGSADAKVLAALAITDRWRRGQEERLLAQCRAIERLNERLEGVRLLKGAEVEIGEDGALELNGDPLRLDLPDLYARRAKDEGVPISLTSDAGSPEEPDNLRFSLGQARRAWLGPADALNTRRRARA